MPKSLKEVRGISVKKENTFCHSKEVRLLSILTGITDISLLEKYVSQSGFDSVNYDSYKLVESFNSFVKNETR